MIYSPKHKGRIPLLLVEYLGGWKTLFEVKERLKQRSHDLNIREIRTEFEKMPRNYIVRAISEGGRGRCWAREFQGSQAKGLGQGC